MPDPRQPADSGQDRGGGAAHDRVVFAFRLGPLVALAIYVAAILTDYFDGIVARRSNEVTGFGKLMDSIADKALIVSVFFALVGEGRWRLGWPRSW